MTDNVPRKGRGFAGMDPAKQREIARKGGRAAHEKGTAHEWSSDEAREAGRLGGKKTSQDNAHTYAAGKVNGETGRLSAQVSNQDRKIPAEYTRGWRVLGSLREKESVNNKFEFKRDGEWTIVVMPEQLVVGNRVEFKDLIFSLMERGERLFVLDFSKAAYVDSPGLGALVRVHKKNMECRGKIVMTGLNADIRTLFELTRLDTFFTIEPIE